MSFARFSKLPPSRSATRQQARCKPRSLQIEALEDRAVPATVVNLGSLGNWAISESGTADVSFEAGPATPPLGQGSAQLSVGSNGGSAAQLRNTGYGGTKLADLTTLGYSTYVDQDGSGGQAPYIILDVDLDGSAATTNDRTQLFFEPVY